MAKKDSIHIYEFHGKVEKIIEVEASKEAVAIRFADANDESLVAVQVYGGDWEVLAFPVADELPPLQPGHSRVIFRITIENCDL